MKIVWDKAKRLANFDKHGLDFALLAFEFFEAAMIEPAKHNRFLAIGVLGGLRIIAVVLAPLGAKAFLAISMRPANKTERNHR